MGRLFDRLVDEDGFKVFADVDTIAPGVDFRNVISSTIANSSVVLVIIGPDWLAVSDPAGIPRIHRDDD